MSASTFTSLDSSPTFATTLPSAMSAAVQTTILSATLVVNFLGNICVCLAVYHVRSLRQKPNSSVLVSLAVSDFSLLSFLVFRLIWLYEHEAACKVSEYFLGLLSILLYVSITHICLLSCDRYAAILYPLRYSAIVTKKRVSRALFAAWFAPVLSITVTNWTHDNSNRSDFWRSIIGCSQNFDKPSLEHTCHIAFNITFFVGIPFAVILFVYGRLAKISWSQNNRVEPGENLNLEAAEMKRKKKKEMKWMRTIAMVVGAFTFCYLPGVICLLITATIGPSRVPNEVMSAVVVMVVINSALNPIIYMIRSNEFQRGFKRIFQFPSLTRNTTLNTICIPIGGNRRDLSTLVVHDDPPSFLGFPRNHATFTKTRRPVLS
ncbi:histamine H2 receptor-like [Pocillopora verrucosa]|uniref:histamine H2 receptor-like n=1 Tax=Pocillopora verrucosa TaxID=203993 RepID=UPI00333F290A